MEDAGETQPGGITCVECLRIGSEWGVEQYQGFLARQSLELVSGVAADVTLRAGEEEDVTTDFPFTRVLLAAQSPVFRVMLYGSMAEAQKDAVVRVKFPAKVVEEMLQYVCTAQLSLNTRTAADLHRLAEFYQIDALRAATMDFILAELNETNAVDLLVAARRNGMAELEAKCIDFVMKHAVKALAGDRLLKLDAAGLLSIVQSDALRMPELDVFRMVLRWGRAKHSSHEDLKAALDPVMQHVRFPLIGGVALAEEAQPSGLVDDSLLAEGFMSKFVKRLSGPRSLPRNKCMMEIETNILDWYMKATLTDMIGSTHGQQIRCRLVHDSSRSVTSAAFHAAVKGVGPTLTVIREQNTKYVFGAYIHDTYGQGRGWIPGHESNFLFSLGSSLNTLPTKLIRGNQLFVQLGQQPQHAAHEANSREQ